MSEAGRRIEIRGTVQGVGFRPWIYRLAYEKGIAGSVSNDSRGVTIDAYGTEAALDSFVDGIRSSPPAAAEIRDLAWDPIPPAPVKDFVIEESRSGGDLAVSIPPDLATCPECLTEVFQINNRRYRYPFTNCTNCGPRFTIATAVPYDRPATTMASFRMCPSCQREYDDPADRRFHAQPNACPACGPRLTALSPAGETLDWSDPIRGAARAMQDGMIVAIKGLGGFHLACDATSPSAVQRLRDRKHREAKPLAVMVRSVTEAKAMADVSDAAERLLNSPERPIVLLPRKPGSPIAREVAPDNPLVGLMLPYTPVHHLLLADAGRPLVMTSGNLADEPIATGNDEALRRLGDVADAFLVHDRPIASRCDDSVARVVAGRHVVLRRSRGYVPRPVPVGKPFERPVLACGPHLKNTFCVGLGSAAYLGPHIGDLENVETLTAFEDAVERMLAFLRVRPEIVAHDLHPGYLSTAYARSRPDVRKIGVQHHHAHVASAMAEHRLSGPVIGVAYDGTGYGTDGTSWGGEILVAYPESAERLGTFRPIALPGGDTAIRQVWRIALALLDDAFEGRPPLERLPVFSTISHREISVARHMIERGVNAPRARGVGRYFDAVGALLLDRGVSRYGGDVALAVNGASDPSERGTYPFHLDDTREPVQADLAAAMRALVEDRIAGVPVPAIAARFHNTLARVTAVLVRRAAQRAGNVPVVLTGGCFQNALLAERTHEALLDEFHVFLHHRVPPGDGGVALGQAFVAAAIAREDQGGL
jgi:hydrogenase maturation protein HypF